MGEGSRRSQSHAKAKEQQEWPLSWDWQEGCVLTCSQLFHLLLPPGLICVWSWYLSAYFAVIVLVINITSGNPEFLCLLIHQTGVPTDFILFTHQFSCSFLFVFVWLVGFFPPQVFKNSPWKHPMKRWWLRSYSRSGHVWISNSYPAGLSWKIYPECSIFQWVSQLITWVPSAHCIQCPCPQHWSAGWGSRGDIPLVEFTIPGGLQRKPASWSQK